MSILESLFGVKRSPFVSYTRPRGRKKLNVLQQNLKCLERQDKFLMRFTKEQVEQFPVGLKIKLDVL